ncbi:terminase gpA endonuclease subunit [uncultured Pseudomonas sp.]|uniref:phage terminase large subunit family protein n=1 Tax=uncultured Pseudomonas sp. TaxID=114707 RepID=UPI0028046EDD|nr:terminase gpA endonuclease subunit [uncultured Pseudomonas sp.]
MSAAAGKFNPPRDIPTAHYLSTEFYLPAESGVLHGLYDFQYTPYFLGVAAALDDPRVSEVDLMKAAQIGWTWFLIGYLFKFIHNLPRPIMILFAKEKDGKNFHDEKLKFGVTANTEVAKLMPVDVSRTSGNRWDHKTFPGGFLKLVASNSPGNVKSTSSVGLSVVEEPDDTSDDVKGQGDAIALLEERGKRYPGSKMLVGGTPAIKGASKTEARLAQTDCRVLPIICHACGQSHVLDFAHIKWLDIEEDAQPHEIYGRADPETAGYGCPHCGEIWDDYQRKENIRITVFNAIDAGDPYCGWVPTKPFAGRAGFIELNELYACLPGTSLADIVREKLNAEHQASIGNLSLLIKFVNQKQGRAYEYKSDLPEADKLADRAEDYPEMFVPMGGLVITAGVDVQHDRLAVVMRAWGRGEESWLIYWGEIYGEVVLPDQGVWLDLEKLLFAPIPHACGAKLRVLATSLDTSDGTITQDAAYAFCRKHQRNGVMAIKGASERGNTRDDERREIFSAPRQGVDTDKEQKASKYGLRPYIVGTSRAKDLWIEGRLPLTGDGPGRMHFYKTVRPDYFRQITAEVKAPSRRHHYRKVWQKKAGQPNEGTDCETYALHAARSLKTHLMREQDWAGLDAQIRQGALFDPPEPDQSKAEPDPETDGSGPEPTPPVEPPNLPPSGGRVVSGRRSAMRVLSQRRN